MKGLLVGLIFVAHAISATIAGSASAGFTEVAETYDGSYYDEISCSISAFAPVDHAECSSQTARAILDVNLAFNRGSVELEISTGEFPLLDPETGEDIGQVHSSGDADGEFLVERSYLILGSAGQAPLSDFLTAGIFAGEGFAEMIVTLDGAPVDLDTAPLVNRGQVYAISLRARFRLHGSLGNGDLGRFSYEFAEGITQIPEPSTSALVLVPLVLFAARRRHTRSR